MILLLSPLKLFPTNDRSAESCERDCFSGECSVSLIGVMLNIGTLLRFRQLTLVGGNLKCMELQWRVKLNICQLPVLSILNDIVVCFSFSSQSGQITLAIHLPSISFVST